MAVARDSHYDFLIPERRRVLYQRHRPTTNKFDIRRYSFVRLLYHTSCFPVKRQEKILIVVDKASVRRYNIFKLDEDISRNIKEKSGEGYAVLYADRRRRPMSKLKDNRLVDGLHVRAFCIAEELVEKYLSMWVDICNIESYTSDKAGVDAVGAYFIRHAKERGYAVDVCRECCSGDALTLIMNPDAEGESVCLSGHMDTVFPRGMFGEVPTRIDGDKIYGPGVCDCKGGLVVAALAMEALQKCGYHARPVKLILQSDEELSSMPSEKRTVAYMAKMAQGCTAFINLEGASPGYHIVERKGIRRYEVDVFGKAAHSSKPECGVNAIVEAAHKIVALSAWEPPEGVTVNVGVIDGGNAANTVAEHCRFVIDFRYVNSRQIKEIEAFLQTIIGKPSIYGARLSLKLRSARVAMPRTKKNEKLLERLNTAYARAGLTPVLPGKATGGSDAADMTEYGIAVVDNVGVTGGRIHSVDEYAQIPTLVENAKRLIAAILYL